MKESGRADPGGRACALRRRGRANTCSVRPGATPLATEPSHPSQKGQSTPVLKGHRKGRLGGEAVNRGRGRRRVWVIGFVVLCADGKNDNKKTRGTLSGKQR